MIFKEDRVHRDANTYIGICEYELFFNIPYPLEPIDSYHHPDLYFHSSGWLIAYPIEVFLKPSNINLGKAIKKLKKETENLGVLPFVKYWSGNYSFGIRLKTKSPTRVETKRIYDAVNHLKQIHWPGGFGINKSK